jgi:integrase/recombinase XerC
LVQGKGAHGSGPRQREAYLFAEGRALLWWYMEEIRGAFIDDPEDLSAPLWPSELHPHLLRHACATHNYETGMSLWEVQKLLGHEWPTTTVRYLATATADPERAGVTSASRAAQRLVMDKGNLR